MLLTGALLPVSRYQFGRSLSFLPAMLAVVACFDLMSVYLLAADYRDTGDRRVLVLACAYVWSLVTMLGYALAFPGAMAAHPPLAVTPSMAPWLYILWHAGFPTIIGLAWAPWPSRWTAQTPLGQRRRGGRRAMAATCVGTAVVVSGFVAAGTHLPRLIEGSDLARMTLLTAPVALPLVLLSTVMAAYGTRDRVGPERWSAIAVLVCLCDLVLTYQARFRFSLGWYAGRSLTLIAAGVVLAAMITALKAARSQAELDATTDSLTGLHNRRSGHRALDQMLAHAQRTGEPLSLIAFDIDRFKQINDRYGHEMGDTVLAQISAAVTGWVRGADVAARIGGEEFLVVLPGTDLGGAHLVAERMRTGVAALRPVGLGHPVTISVGVDSTHPGDTTAAELLRRVDAAVYAAKHRGRNTTVLATPADRAAMDMTAPPVRV